MVLDLATTHAPVCSLMTAPGTDFGFPPVQSSTDALSVPDDWSDCGMPWVQLASECDENASF